MNKRWLASFAASLVAAGIYMLTPAQAQDPSISQPDCPFFGPERERFTPNAVQSGGLAAGRLTRQFRAAATGASHAGRTLPFSGARTGKAGLIDQYIHADLLANGVSPSEKI